MLFSTRIAAFAAGAPICEVNTLPLSEMSPVLADPAPSGWFLESSSAFYYPGTPLQVRVRNANNSKRVRGAMLWAKASPTVGIGSFALPPGKLFQYIPAPAQCAQWAISHNSSVPKAQSDLRFAWSATDGVGTVVLRAFLIEDCGLPSGCRAHQALTPVLILQAGIFKDGLESTTP